MIREHNKNLSDQCKCSKRVRKIRASVRCVNFGKLLEERLAARRKFRATVDAVVLINSLAIGIAARRKFKAAVRVIILSHRLVDRPLQRRGRAALVTFQDSVHLVVAVNHLERKANLPSNNAKQGKYLNAVTESAVASNNELPQTQLVNMLTPTWHFCWQEVQTKAPPKAE